MLFHIDLAGIDSDMTLGLTFFETHSYCSVSEGSRDDARVEEARVHVKQCASSKELAQQFLVSDS